MLSGPDSSATGIEAATTIAVTISHQVSCYSWLYMFTFWGGGGGIFTCSSILTK